MKPERIARLLEVLPAKAPIYTNMGPALDSSGRFKNPLVQRLSYAVKDPAFPYVYVQACIQMGIPLPFGVTEEYMHRAYDFEVHGLYHEPLIQALIYRDSSSRLEENQIQVWLISSLAMEKISEELFVDIDALRIYERLFFSIRDRLDNTVLMSRLVFGEETRRNTLSRNYFFSESPHRLALQAAYDPHVGLAGARSIYGMPTRDEVDLPVDVLANDYHKSTMRKASEISAMGGGNADMPVNYAARQFMNSAIQNSEKNQNGSDDKTGLTAVGNDNTPGRSILATAVGMNDTSDFENRKRARALKQTIEVKN